MYARKRVRAAAERRLRTYWHQEVFDRDDPNLGGIIEFVAEGTVYRPQWHPIWKTKSVWRGKIRTAHELEAVLLTYPTMTPPLRRRAAKWIASVLQLAGERGTLHDFILGAPTAVKEFLAPYFIFTVRDGGTLPAANLDLSDLRIGRAVYSAGNGLLSEENYKARTLDFERMWQCKVVIETLKDRNGKPVAGHIVVRAYPTLPEEIPLDTVLDGDRMKIHIGVNAQNARPVWIPYDKLLHLCIQGITGFGKSWWIKVLLRQLKECPQVNSITLICFKGAVDYMDMFGPRLENGQPSTDYYYCRGGVWLERPPGVDAIRIRIIWDLDAARTLIKAAVREMEEVRQPLMREYGYDYWPGGDDWIICDEFAYILQQPNAKDVVNTWTMVGLRGRAPGFRLLCCTQQCTVDAIPSQLRQCLETKICLRVETLQIAAGMFGSTQYLPQDPTKTENGKFQTYLNLKHDDQQYYICQGYRA